MDYLILILLAACLLIMLVIHQDIIQFGEGYNRTMGQLLPRLASVGQPMKNALTLSCVIFFGGAIARTFTEDDRTDDHYSITPYRYTPKKSNKLVPSEFVDLGQGVLELVEEIHRANSSA